MYDSINRDETIRALIEKVNASISYVDIKKGNQILKYAEVKERIKAFRLVYPEGGIATKIIDNDKENGVITIKAEIFNENGSLLSTGTASENVNDGIVNKSGNFVENCETSAVGRALAFLGIGIGDGIATAEDMKRVTDRKEIEDGLRLCRRCRQKIIDAKDNNGEIIKADTIAKETLRVYGDTYCLSCAAILKHSNLKILEV